mmetsp:Transcript_43719/g.113973  ORF Transcript_43719/g.113973 Transcript_43719/m.113973 type:complete len:423 (-) Transcript_43719:197-1465(-)
MLTEETKIMTGGNGNSFLAVSACRRMVAMMSCDPPSPKKIHGVSVLYVEEGENHPESKPDETTRSKSERIRKRKRKRKRVGEEAVSSPPLVYSSVTYHTVFNQAFGYPCSNVCFSPCSRFLAMVCMDGMLHVWYIRSRHREVRWNQENKKSTAVWSAPFTPSVSSSVPSPCARGGIPSFTPVLCVNYKAFPRGGKRILGWSEFHCAYCFFSPTSNVLCVITPNYTYTWRVVGVDSYDPSFTGIERRSPSSSPSLVFCCRLNYPSWRIRFRPGYYTGVNGDENSYGETDEGRVSYWITFGSSDERRSITRHRKEIPVSDEKKSLCFCKKWNRRSPTSSSSVGCGMKLTRNKINLTGAPPFLETTPDDWMGNTFSWSPSGEMVAVGINRLPPFRKVRWPKRCKFGCDGTVLLLRRKGVSLQYEQ